MARRDIQSFNLSFLDLLSGALGAVIFLFIIVPKGKSAFPLLQKNADASVLLDTQTMRIIGRPVTGARFKVGDTITVIINGSYKDPVDSLIASVDNKFWNNYYPSQVTAPRVTVPADPVQPAPTTATTPAITPPPPPQPPSDDRSYKGPKPSAPCKLAFELSWGDEKDNVDILVQKGGVKSIVVTAAERNHLPGNCTPDFVVLVQVPECSTDPVGVGAAQRLQQVFIISEHRVHFILPVML